MDSLTYSSKSNKKAIKPSTIIIYLILIISCLLVVVPIIWIIFASISPGNTLDFGGILTLKPTLIHYKELFANDNKFGLNFFNTIKISAFTMIFTVIITVGGAYVFSRFRFKGRRASLMAIMVLQMFPNYLAMTAIYIFLLRINLLNTHPGIILIYLAGQIPYNTWLLKGYLDGINKSLDEAAKIDGASNFVIFTKIILPLTKPMITYVALNSFLASIMDYVMPQIVLRDPDKTTLAVYLYNLVQGTNYNYTEFAAGAVLVSIPAIILSVVLQKYIVEGMSAGAVKI